MWIMTKYTKRPKAYFSVSRVLSDGRQKNNLNVNDAWRLTYGNMRFKFNLIIFYIIFGAGFSAKKLPKDVNKSAVFACNELDLNEIHVYGFDYDYTLACYKASLNDLLYNLGRDTLIEKFKVNWKLNKARNAFITNESIRFIFCSIQRKSKTWIIYPDLLFEDCIMTSKRVFCWSWTHFCKFNWVRCIVAWLECRIAKCCVCTKIE